MNVTAANTTVDLKPAVESAIAHAEQASNKLAFMVPSLFTRARTEEARNNIDVQVRAAAQGVRDAEDALYSLRRKSDRIDTWASTTAANVNFRINWDAGMSYQPAIKFIEQVRTLLGAPIHSSVPLQLIQAANETAGAYRAAIVALRSLEATEVPSTS